MLRYIAISILILISHNRANAQWSILREDADSLIMVGSGYIYNVQFDEAEKCFDQVIASYPDHPAGYFLSAMVDWWQIVLYREVEVVDRSFLKKIEIVIDKCDNLLEKNEFDITGLFFLGGAYGYRGRYHAKRDNWISAANDGRRGFEILRQCWQVAPGNSDIKLGTGIYNYFADVIPEKYPVVKPLVSFFPKGDKELGILQLKAAAKSARYAPTEALVTLLQVYYEFEKDYYKALEIAEQLISKYPNNPYFHRYYGRALVTVGDQSKWEEVWREVIKRCIRKERGYDRVTAREGLYYIGLSLMQKAEYSDALKYLYKCDEACRYIDEDGESGFMVMTNLKIGQIYDKQGKRDLAIKQYKKLIKMDDYNNSHSLAKKYIQKPYGK